MLQEKNLGEISWDYLLFFTFSGVVKLLANPRLSTSAGKEQRDLEQVADPHKVESCLASNTVTDRTKISSNEREMGERP